MSTPLRVLIVEDSEDDAVLLLHELRRGGYDPTSERVDTPEAMNTALDRQTWDIVLSDHAMPRFSMPAALTMVREKGFDLPFIIVSGAIGEEAAVAAMRAGAQDYVMKANLARLVPVVERELREAEIRREHDRMEQALRESKEKYRTILEDIEDGYFEVDIAGNFTFFNDPMCGIIGYSRDEMMGMNNRQFMDKKNAKKVYQAFNRVYTTGKANKEFGWEIIRKDGTKRFIEASFSLRRNSEGEPIGFRGIIRDITERKEAGEALRESEEKLRVMFESTSEGIAITDLKGKILDVNDAILRMSGLSREELIGQEGFGLMPREDAKGIIGQGKKAIKSKAGTEKMIQEITPTSGRSYDVGLSMGVLRDSSGDPMGFVAIVRDITERKRAEEALRESEDKYRKLFELGSDALFLIEVETGRILDLNDTALKMYGYSREEALQMKNTNFSAEPAQTRQATVEHEQQIPVRYHKKKDGTIFPTDISVAYYTWYEREVCIAAIRDITERKRAEEALRESEEKLRLFMESATDFYTIWDSELNLVDLNEASLRYPLIRLPAGAKKEDFIGKNMLELEPHVKERGKYDQYLEVIKTGKPFFTEDIVPYPKHGDVHLEVRTFKVGDGLGIVTADITERKWAEEALRENEEKLRIMFESIRDGITVTDLEGRIIDMNEAALRLHGFSNREEVIGQNGLMLAAEKDRARARENARRTFKEGRSGTVEYTLLTKGGKEFEAEYGGALVRDGFGKAVGFIGMVRDITERKRAEEELRESEEKLRLFMESATDFYTIWDSELNLVDLNEASLRYPLIRLPAEVKKEDFIGKNMLELEPHVKERGKYDQYLEVIKTGKPFFTEDIVPYPKHGDVHLEVRAFKVGDGLGIVTADITERKRAEEELRESEEKLRSFMESATDFFTIWDSELNLVDLNEASLRYPLIRLPAGVKKEDFIGKNMLELEPHVKERGKYDQYLEVIKTGKPFFTEDIVPYPKHGDVHLEVRAFKVGDGLGIVTADITERKRMEEVLIKGKEQLEQRTNQLLALQKVTATIQSTLEVSEVLQQISDGVVVNLGFDHTLMFVVDEARNIHRTVVYSTKEESGLVGEVQQALDQTWAELEFSVIKGYSHALDEVMEGRVVTAHHLYEIAEPPFTRDECNAVQELISAKAMVIVPFFARDKYMGSIVAFTEREEITEGEIEPLRILADQAGVAIENANLYQGVRERAQRLAVTSELSRIIGSSLNISETYQALTTEIKKIIDFDLSIITHVEGDRLRFLAVSTEGETGMDEGGTVPLTGTATAWIVENKRTNIETDFAQGVQFPIDVGYMKSGLRSAIRVPLLSKGNVLGTFQLISRHPNAYGEREREILEPVAAQIAAAIENSRLFIQVKEHEAELERAYKELKEAQDYMVRSERLRALGEMAGGVAHDFNNILAIVLGRAQLALEDQEGDKVMKSVRVIEQTALDAAKTVRRLQDFAGVRASSTFEAVNLNQLIEGALEMVESRRVKLEETEGVRIEIGTELNEVAPVAGDAAELREALVNIIFNAMDAMPEGGKITVKSEQENSLVVLSVSDTGVGIPEEIKGKLFDPFFTTRAPAGTGLGLSVTYGIVTRHGGSIEVESTQGKGATFYIRLPVADSVEARSRPERKPPTIKRATILLADDDPEVSEILGLMLQQLGHQVTVVTSGEEALSAFEKGDYALVITDLGMPDISGRDVARAVKELKPEMPVMLITGWGVQFDPEEMPDIDGVIEKPFSRDALLAQIAELLPTRNRGKRG